MNFEEYTLHLVSDEYLAGYDGLNYEAAQFLGFDKTIEPNEILINNTLDFTLKVHTIIHEIAESKKMRCGWEYFPAHEHAEKMESEFINLKVMFNYIFSHREFYDWLSSGSSDAAL